jgi:hypothetical protein
MATTPNPTEQQLLEQNGIQQPVEQTPASAEPPQLQREYVKQVGGSVYKGKTQAELIDELAKAKEHQDAELARLHQLEKQWKTQPTATPAQPTFDQAKYWELMGTNPLEAQEYALQFTPAARSYREQLDKQQQFIQQLENQTKFDKFRAMNDDFPADDKDPNVEAFEKYWGELGLPFTEKHLDLAWKAAKVSGVVKPAQAAAATTAPTVPPTLDGSPSGNPGGINPNTMPLAELEALLRRNEQ